MERPRSYLCALPCPGAGGPKREGPARDRDPDRIGPAGPHGPVRPLRSVDGQERAEGRIPPLDVVRDLAALGEWPFPPLVGITEVPSVRPDGALFTQAGYDPLTRLLYIPAPGPVVPPVPDDPAEDQRTQALARLQEVVEDSPFEDGASKANALGAILTLVIRPIIPGCVPMVLFDKPQAGVGATLLANVTSQIATGRPSAILSAPRDDDAWRKRITALLLAGHTMICVDNIEDCLFAPSLGHCSGVAGGVVLSSLTRARQGKRFVIC